MKPVATATQEFMNWPTPGFALILIVVAATAAFASTGNAGILAASRYPFAMARDRLVPTSLAKLGRFSTPTAAILLTSGLIILIIIALDVEGIAKLASAFQLFIFILVNLAVIVMRESRIASYDPGFESPLYPWMQVFGMVTSLALIVAMGWLASLFTLGIIILCLIWFHYYAKDRVVRDGAIYHWFAHLGRRVYWGLDFELRSILKEKGLRDEDPFEKIVADAIVLDVETGERTFDEVMGTVSGLVVSQMPDRTEELSARFDDIKSSGPLSITKGVALPHMHLASLEHPLLVIVRSRGGILHDKEDPIYALFMLISEEENARQHLRMLAQIAVSVDAEGFIDQWRTASNEQALKEILLRDERYISLHIHCNAPSKAFIGKTMREVELPTSALVVLIRRENSILIPHGNTVLHDEDQLTIIGEPKDIRTLYWQYAQEHKDASVS